jgi:hypothetical protein
MAADTEPKYFFAVASDNTTLPGSLRTVDLSPSIRGNVNNSKKSRSVAYTFFSLNDFASKVISADPGITLTAFLISCG